MNVLLLLSALLSALSGFAGQARAPVAVQAVAEVAAARSPAGAVARASVTRPVAGLPALVRAARALLRIAALPVQVAPLWANRRRE